MYCRQISLREHQTRFCLKQVAGLSLQLACFVFKCFCNFARTVKSFLQLLLQHAANSRSTGITSNCNIQNGDKSYHTLGLFL
jgi:hypothetical protein